MLSLIIPARDWPQERLDYCVRSFLGSGSTTLSEIIVVDFGSARPLTVPNRTGVRAVRLEADRWSLPEAINAGVLLAANELIAKTDADILITPKSGKTLDEAARKVGAGEWGLALAQATDLPPGIGPKEAFSLAASATARPGAYRPKWGQGGLVVFSRATWDEVGGFDSRFTGWGNEDNDFAERVRRSGKRPVWMDRDKMTILHVWHPPSYAATGVLKERQRNQEIAHHDRSILRPVRFRHSNFVAIAGPQVVRTARPLVTLGIATSARPNRDRMIVEAINSFRGQVDNDFEVLIVDNGSSVAETKQLEQRLRRIRWTSAIRLETSSVASIPAARNQISRDARGRYICVVDDDDIALPNRLEDHLAPFAADGSIHGTHGGWIDFDEATGVIERNQGKARTIATLLRGTGKITAHPASFFRTDVMRAVPYDEAFALGSDLDLAIRMASSGLEVAHTNSYLTLRRYHSTNVTITGQANQVSNGALAKSRALSTFDWPSLAGLEEQARANDKEVYCRNQMSIESLAELIPGYSGTWQIFVPVAALAAPQRDTLQADPDDVERPAEEAGLQEQSGPPGETVDATSLIAQQSDASDLGVVQQLTEILPGELATRHSGLNQIVHYRSATIAGLKKARALKAKVEDLIGRPVYLHSARQAEIDREVRFDWRLMSIPSGERILLSQRFGDVADVLLALGAVAPDSLLRSALSVLSDYDDNGEAYYLVTTPIRGHEDLRRVEFELERTLGVAFHHVASQGVVSELMPSMGPN